MNYSQLLFISTFSSLLTWSAAASAEPLTKVIDQTLRSNPQAKVALSTLKVNQKNIGTAAADFWPTLDIAAGIGEQKKDTNTTEGERLTRKEASLSLKQNLFSGFNTWHTVKRARTDAEAQHWRLYSTLESLTLQVINAYLKVLERRDLVEQAEENLEIHHTIFSQIERRSSQGVARSSDVIQVAGRRARAHANLINARNNLIDAESEYHALVGQNPGDLEFPSFERLDLPEDLQQAIKKGRQDHPSIKAAELDIESAEHVYSSRKSSYLPTLDAELEHSWKHNVDGQLGDYNDTVAMVRFRYNIFRGGGDKARLMASAYQAEERRSQKAKVLRDVEERIRTAWAALQYIGDQREYLLLHEEASRKTVAAYREQFNIGKRTLLDLLDSENERFQSSNTLTAAIYQEAYARYRVLAAAGKLLENVGFTIPKDWQLED